MRDGERAIDKKASEREREGRKERKKGRGTEEKVALNESQRFA